MAKITVQPSGKVFEIDSETNLFQALKKQDVYIKASCGGHASCTDCVIKVLAGKENLSPAEFDELQLMGNVFHITKERLSCQTRALGDIEIDVSAHDLSADQEKLKSKKKKVIRTKVRKKDEVKEVLEERAEMMKDRDTKNSSWDKHWVKDKDAQAVKRLGGGKRPKIFRTDHLDVGADNDPVFKNDEREANREAEIRAREDRLNPQGSSPSKSDEKDYSEEKLKPRDRDLTARSFNHSDKKENDKDSERKSFRKK